MTVGTLSIRQGGVNIANADSIDIRQGGITRAEARDISVVQGGIAIARADRVSVGMGGIGLAVAGQVDVTRGFARTVIARDVRIEQAGARTVIASRATFDKTSGALVVIAAKAEGNVRTLLDWRGRSPSERRSGSWSGWSVASAVEQVPDWRAERAAASRPRPSVHRGVRSRAPGGSPEP